MLGKIFNKKQGKVAVQENKLQKEASASRDKYKLLADNSTDGMFLTDRKGLLTYVNPASEDMFSHPASKSLGTNFSKYLNKKLVVKATKLYYDTLSRKIGIN